MVVMSISQSVEEELVWVGAPLKKSLREAAIDRIDDLVRYQFKGKFVGLSDAERAAIDAARVKNDQRAPLDISWALTANDKPMQVKNALVLAHEDQHRVKPGHPSENGWILGVAKGGKVVAEASLEWSDWHTADDSAKSHLPQSAEGGVYRIRVAKG